ncbi:MAG: threonine/serine exporter family protein [Oscillospiraceae bacterium]
MFADNIIFQYIIEIASASIGAVFVSLWYNIKGYRLILIALGSAISWLAYLITLNIGNDKVLSLFIATIVVSISGEILARIVKAPVLVLLVPMLIPLVPGGDLYYTTLNLIRGDITQFRENFTLFAKEAGAIAFAIIFVTCFVQVLINIKKYNVKNRLKR